MSHEQPLRIRSVAIVLTIIGTAIALGPLRPLLAQDSLGEPVVIGAVAADDLPVALERFGGLSD